MPTQSGWLYIAIALDLATRAVVGWALSARMQTDLIVAALRMAKQHRAIGPGMIFHSDRCS